MPAILQRFLLFLAAATDRELARMVEYLKAENRILRDKLPKRINVTASERRTLLKYGKRLGTKIREVIAIVSPRTFLRWQESERRPGKTRELPPGRPRTPEEIREVVLRLARDNAWGYTRILGELKKLGVRNITRSTVQNILKAEGLDPGPKRGNGSWDEFLKRHVQTLWACDFFSKKVWTAKGLVEVFVLFFIHVGSRRVYLGGLTTNPDGPWMKQQVQKVVMHFGDQPIKPTYLLRDHDTKFTKEFDVILASEGVTVVKVGPLAPNMNAVAERFVQSVRVEALDHFVVFGEAHLRHICTEYVAFYNQVRPHQGVGNEPLGGLPPGDHLREALSLVEVQCQERLGGLLNHYSRRAA
jgi:putative transposase